jgi:trimeric autotransporter adhesin
MNPGQTCRIYVTFTPTALGSANGQLTVNSNDASPDAGSEKIVSLSGTGVRLSASPTTLNFLTFNVNFSGTQNVTVTNNGPGAINGAITTSITNVTNGVTFNVQSTTCPTTASGSLAQGASCLVRVRFRSPTPFTQGTGTLTITDSLSETATVGLTGFRF